MAKQRKLLPALSMRSAERLGRVIGTLQRQINAARRSFTGDDSDAAAEWPQTESPRRRRARPRLAASADPSPSRHPRKTATNGLAPRAAGRAAKRTARPK